jgi:hypothetical protein
VDGCGSAGVGAGVGVGRCRLDSVLSKNVCSLAYYLVINLISIQNL